jgi:hypothetical protein
MDQCVQEVQAEPDGDDQSDNRLTHCGLLQLTQGERVEAHQSQNHDTKRHKCDVEHDRLLAPGLLAPSRVRFPY